MNVKAQKFQSLYVLVCKSSARWNHRTTLPQSRPLGVPAPSEREPGTAAPFIVPPGNRNVAGDFHRPYERAAQKLPVSTAKTIPGGPGHLPYGNPPKAQLKKEESGQTLPRRKSRRLYPRRAIRTWARGNQPVPAAEKRKSCGGQHTAAADFLRQK